MKIRCGTDIIEIERMKNSIERSGKKFLETIFTENEITYCEKHRMQKYQHYAVRFAAKEAVFKAISEKKDTCSWNKIEILNEVNGRPTVNFLEPIENLESIDISLSHCKTFATANAIAIFKED